MRLPKITSLYGRIFAIFWFTMFLVTLAVLALPKLDPRLTKDISVPHYEDMKRTKDRVERELSVVHDLQQALNVLDVFSKRRGGDRKLRLFITDQDGNIQTPLERERNAYSFRALRNFVTIVEDPNKSCMVKPCCLGLFQFKHLIESTTYTSV